MTRDKKTFLFILILALLAAWFDLPGSFNGNVNIFGRRQHLSFSRPDLNFGIGPLRFSRKIKLKKGLDIAGGVRLVFNAQMDKIPEKNRDDALHSVEENIRRRVDIFGLGEVSVRMVKSVSDHRLVVEIPGGVDSAQAVSLIGRTAQLSFKKEVAVPPEATESATVYDVFSQNTGITGAYLKKASVIFDKNTGKPQISLSFNPEGTKKFAQVTKSSVGKRLAIFLDDFLLMAPTVKEPILDGSAVINGEFDLKTAKQITSQLNAGALPVPLKLVEQSVVSPTLGNESIKKGVIAGSVGVAVEAAFMILVYGALGGLAVMGLLIYGILSLALYKLIPITLTMSGVTGFLLSMGMAVDANILIFERIREESRHGRPWQLAIDLGFGRAWNSIRDANVATLITAFVLINPFEWPFLNTSGMVRGFAITLGLGILLELFTSIVVVRTLIKVLYPRVLAARQQRAIKS